MDVAGHAGAGDAAEVDADVEALRGNGSLQELHSGRRLHRQVELFRFAELFKIRLVRLWRDEQMAVGVGVAVDDDHRMVGRPQDEPVAPLGGRRGGGSITEKAFVAGGLVDRFDVVHPPGSVESRGVHERILIASVLVAVLGKKMQPQSRGGAENRRREEVLPQMKSDAHRWEEKKEVRNEVNLPTFHGRWLMLLHAAASNDSGLR